MKNIRNNKFYADNLWRWKCGIPEKSSLDKFKFGEYKDFDLTFIKPKEFDEILELADNRMRQGTFRYGDINRQNIDNYNVVFEIHKRTELYKESKNLDYLIDTLNMVRIEYMKAKKSGKKLIPIDDGYHTKEIEK